VPKGHAADRPLKGAVAAQIHAASARAASQSLAALEARTDHRSRGAGEKEEKSTTEHTEGTEKK